MMSIEIPAPYKHACTGDALRCFDGNGCECAMNGNAPARVEYTAEQMRAWGEACKQAEREACAKAAERLDLLTDSTGVVRLGDVDCIAAVIRARSKVAP